jgi:hypothetical protein
MINKEFKEQIDELIYQIENNKKKKKVIITNEIQHEIDEIKKIQQDIDKRQQEIDKLQKDINERTQIDIIRTSSSRPELLELTTHSLQKHLKFDGNFRWLIHEDAVNDRSPKCMDFIENSGIYNVYKQDSPPVGQGNSLFWLLNQVKSKYILYIEDDWRLLKDINLNEVINIMEEHNDVNQICFNKRAIMKKKQWFTKKEVYKNNIALTTNMYWTFIPSLWRMSYIKDKIPYNLKECTGGQLSYGVNTHLRQLFGNGEDQNQFHADWVIKNTGTYFLGNVINLYKEAFNLGELSEDEYYKLNNGVYFQHLGYSPYEPEKWIWPIPKQQKIKGTDWYTVMERPNGVKWNPTMKL